MKHATKDKNEPVNVAVAIALSVAGIATVFGLLPNYAVPIAAGFWFMWQQHTLTQNLERRVKKLEEAETTGSLVGVRQSDKR